MDLKEYIPFEKKEFRPGQEKAIEDILNSIEDGNKYTVLNAPVGVGKSLCAYIIAKKFEESGMKSYLCTGTKILQSQYINDFTDVKTIKGRMNFDCSAEPLFDCSKGMCQSHSKYRCDFKPILKEDWEYSGTILPKYPNIKSDGSFHFYGDPDFDEMYLGDMCDYWKQKITGIMSPITMLNYDYLISDVRFVKHLPHRKLLICDEAHNIEQILMRQLEAKFSPSNVKKETGFNIKNTSIMSEWGKQLDEIADLYRELSKTATDSKKKKMHEKYMKFASLAFLIESDPQNWVYINEKSNGHTFLTFKPIQVSNYTKMIFNLADNIILMSGTILKSDILARDLGINSFEYIEVPSIIPPENRPIIKAYVGSMSRTSIDATMPNMIAMIKKLSKKHDGEKGLIHTYTYSVANRIKQEFGENERFMFHNSNNKEDIFNDFKADTSDKILVSPVAFEGVDFPYDQGRWQCICKDPFPNLGDIQLTSRDAVDYQYIFRQRCKTLSQAYGRCNRATDDYSVTYLLDSRLESLLGPSTLVTSYFLEGLQDLKYSNELVLLDNAYEKLTKDNARKTHEFDREVEKSILKDIEDGYNSLEKLHKAYKKFPSDAYIYIMPAVDRLLKHGAIDYK